MFYVFFLVRIKFYRRCPESNDYVSFADQRSKNLNLLIGVNEDFAVFFTFVQIRIKFGTRIVTDNFIALL